jgi:hypothetical protein
MDLLGDLLLTVVRDGAATDVWLVGAEADQADANSIEEAVPPLAEMNRRARQP